MLQATLPLANEATKSVIKVQLAAIYEKALQSDFSVRRTAASFYNPLGKWEQH